MARTAEIGAGVRLNAGVLFAARTGGVHPFQLLMERIVRTDSRLDQRVFTG